MSMKLAEQKLELNSALLKVIERDSAIEHLSEQLQSMSWVLIVSSSFLRTCHNSLLCSSFRDKTELDQSQMAREQDTTALNQAQDAQRESEAARRKNTEDMTKLERSISTAMTGLVVSLEPVTPETQVEEVGRLRDVVQELELVTARRAVHRVLAMFESHYQGLDRMALSGGWAPGISDAQCDELEEDCASFARDMTDATLIWSYCHKMHQRTRKPPSPRVNCIIFCLM
jgi:hypothetical protein